MENNISVQVEGMTCGNCALTITKLLEKKGVRNIAANAATGEVSFTIVEDKNVAQIYDAIDDLGYKVQREENQSLDNADLHKKAGAFDRENVFLLICAVFTLPLLLHMFLSWHWLHHPMVQWLLSTPVFIIGCYVFLPSAYRSVKVGIPNMNVLIIIGAMAAYFYSLLGWLYYPEQAHDFLFFETTASIITLVMVGNWLEHKTVKSTTQAIDELVKLQPQYAKIVLTDSVGKQSILEVESKFVKKDDVVLVNKGDTIPVDGEIFFGEAQIDEHMITGESLPVHKTLQQNVVGGTLLLDGNIKVKATAVGNSSVLAQIIKMVREAQAVKPPLQKLADKISAIFVPVVLGIAILTFLINYFGVHTGLGTAMMRSIAVMVISCPCAMGLATPAAVAVGLGRSARNGMLIKGGDTLSSMKKIKQIVFDKTGTLTTGDLKIASFIADIDETYFKQMVVAIEQHSSHPIAKSITAQWKDNGNVEFISIEELQGKGMRMKDKEGNVWCLGSQKWLHKEETKNVGFDLYLYKNQIFVGAMMISDALRDDAVQTIDELKKMGFKTILLSGDKASKVSSLAAQIGIDEFYAEQSPEQKKIKLDELMSLAPTAMVGDGINDAPALARATIGIALSESTQIAIQSANVILSNNQLSTLPKAIRLGRFTDQTIQQNLFWALIYNVVAIPVAAFGFLSPVVGAGVMALSDVILIINSLRLSFRRID